MNSAFKLLILIVSIVFSFHVQAQNDYHFNTIEFETSDSITIKASYQYPKTKLEKYPVLILIHQGGSSRAEWFELPLIANLLEKGYAILAYDIRQHGTSGKDEGTLSDLFNNPKRAPLDLKAAIGFLKQDKNIDSDRIGIIGASIGANLACAASVSDSYNIKSIVSISAKTEAVQNLSGLADPIKPKTAYFIASKNEQNGLRADWAEELFDITTGERKLGISAGDKHGSFILRGSKILQDSIIAWFEKTL